eukprot:7990654-Alexandrium_andersonii.AAC.1
MGPMQICSNGHQGCVWAQCPPAAAPALSSGEQPCAHAHARVRMRSSSVHACVGAQLINFSLRRRHAAPARLRSLAVDSHAQHDRPR